MRGLLVLLGLGALATFFFASTSAAQTVSDSTTQVPGTAPMSGSGIARGVGDNNPFNIKYVPANNWDGQTGSDGTFCVFNSPVKGYSAGFKLLFNWYSNYGLDTVSGIINRQAPPSENNTSAYIKYVAENLDVGPDDVLNIYDDDTLLSLANAMTSVEQGSLPWGQDVIAAGLADAKAAKGIA